MGFNDRVVVVGGGTAGITCAARLRRKKFNNVTIIDPAEKHYYQPLFTLVGGGAVDFNSTFRNMRSVIPSGVEWIQKSVDGVDPKQGRVHISDGNKVDYDQLIVCPGIQTDWNKIDGLEATLGKNGVCSNYSVDTVTKTWEAIRNTKEGVAIFTYPNTPVKCGGAPQKIMYLAEHYFRKCGVRNNIKVIFVSAGGAIFGVKKYAAALSKIIEHRDIQTLFGHNLVKVDSERKVATFKNVETGENKDIEFTMIHVTPPMSCPDFISSSGIANEGGWVDVNKESLRATKYDNIFSLGDASSLPTSKTGAAIRKQAPILVENLVASLTGKPLTSKYDGYTSCPLVTGYGRLILAEFDYDGNPAETFPFDQSKERLSMYLLKKYGLPFMYWHGMLKGIA